MPAASSARPNSTAARCGRVSLSIVPDSKALPRKQTRLSLVWFIIPILAAALGVWVAVARIRSEGPKITIVFESAEGLEAGKTKINYRGVDVGTITAIRLSRDHERVIATAQMTPRTEDFLVEDTRLWVVRPRISGANVTGLGISPTPAGEGRRSTPATRRLADSVSVRAPNANFATDCSKDFTRSTRLRDPKSC